MDKEAHEPADIIICQPKSFFNRHQRGNMNLQHCKFVAIDEIDEIFISDKPTLREILKIIGTARPSLIVCSATMQNEFLDFFQECVKYYITVNINKLVEE